MADMAPKQPSCEGPQFDSNKEYLSVHYDGQGNEIAEDRPMHENTTPAMGSPNYGAKHYADDFKSYGSAVGGSSTSRQSTDVTGDAANRGDES